MASTEHLSSAAAEILAAQRGDRSATPSAAALDIIRAQQAATGETLVEPAAADSKQQCPSPEKRPDRAPGSTERPQSALPVALQAAGLGPDAVSAALRAAGTSADSGSGAKSFVSIPTAPASLPDAAERMFGSHLDECPGQNSTTRSWRASIRADLASVPPVGSPGRAAALARVERDHGRSVARTVMTDAETRVTR